MMVRPNMVLASMTFMLFVSLSTALAHHNPGYYFDMRERVVHTDATVSIVGWPARNGKDDMTISAITTERSTTVILDEVNYFQYIGKVFNLTINP